MLRLYLLSCVIGAPVLHHALGPEMAPLGVATGLVLALNWRAWYDDPAEHADSAGIALMLFLSFCLTLVVQRVWSPPAAFLLNPPLDLACGTVVAVSWLTRRERWKAALFWLYVAQCCAHVAFWAQGRALEWAEWWYVLALNVTNCLQLAVAAWPGGRHAALRLAAVGRLPDRPGAGGAAVPDAR